MDRSIYQSDGSYEKQLALKPMATSFQRQVNFAQGAAKTHGNVVEPLGELRGELGKVSLAFAQRLGTRSFPFGLCNIIIIINIITALLTTPISNNG